MRKEKGKQRHLLQRILLVCMVVSLSIVPVMNNGGSTVYASDNDSKTFDISQGPIKIETGTNTGTLKVTHGDSTSQTIVDNIPCATNIIITGETDQYGVTVARNTTANITLQDCNIDVGGLQRVGAFNMIDATVSLTLDGENVLKSGDFFAGIQVPDGSNLTIQAVNSYVDTSGKLTTTGGDGGAGIGDGWRSVDDRVGTITINSGVIEANGSRNAAGIGGGNAGQAGTVIINGGIVSAVGNGVASSIGAGYGKHGGTVTISGGTVNAEKLGDGGSSGNSVSGTGGNVTISGGIVNAKSIGNGGNG